MSGKDEGWFRIQIGSLDQWIILVPRPRHFGGQQLYFMCWGGEKGTRRPSGGNAALKSGLRATANKWMVSQHNPPEGMSKDFTLSRKEWSIGHRVTGKFTRR
jgi:hypothetical protein